MTLNRQELAKLGEELAKEYLLKKGYYLIEQNYTKRYGELDLVMLNPPKEKLVVIEVKTRYQDSRVSAREAITNQKLSQLKSITLFLKKELGNSVPDSLRIDLIAITLNYKDSIKELEHVKNITQ